MTTRRHTSSVTRWYGCWNSLKWALWHGNVYKAFHKIVALAMDLDVAVAITGDATARKLLKAMEEFHTYLVQPLSQKCYCGVLKVRIKIDYGIPMVRQHHDTASITGMQGGVNERSRLFDRQGSCHAPDARRSSRGRG